MSQPSYPVSITPAVLGVLVGALLATIGHGTEPISVTYVGLPEFHLWRTGVVAQAAMYFAVSTFIWLPHAEWKLPTISLTETLATVALTVFVITLPNLFVRFPLPLPLPRHNLRMQVIVLFGMIAVVGIMYRVAQLQNAFRSVEDLARFSTLRQNARDLLGLAALVVTLATLGSGLLQISLSALANACPGYDLPMTDRHVIAYGGYFTLLLVLFFTPLLAAERLAALRLVETNRADVTASVVEDLGLRSSFTENVRSAFGLLAPLLGALATRLLS